MPMFDYECTKCGHLTQHLVRLRDRDEPQACEVCAGVARRLPVQKPGGFALKGSGWYADGYQKKAGET